MLNRIRTACSGVRQSWSALCPRRRVSDDVTASCPPSPHHRTSCSLGGGGCPEGRRIMISGNGTKDTEPKRGWTGLRQTGLFIECRQEGGLERH